MKVIKLNKKQFESYVKNLTKEILLEQKKTLVGKDGKAVDRATLKKHADALERVAIKRDNMAKREKDDTDGKEMKKMFLGDAKDFRKLKDFVKAGKLKSALSKLENMDTESREQCPMPTWNFLNNFVYGKDKD